MASYFVPYRFFSCHFFSGDGQIPLYYFLHLFLNCLQVFIRQGVFQVEIVVKPVVDPWANGNLHSS